jgi:hypothetical protein
MIDQPVAHYLKTEKVGCGGEIPAAKSNEK